MSCCHKKTALKYLFQKVLTEKHTVVFVSKSAHLKTYSYCCFIQTITKVNFFLKNNNNKNSKVTLGGKYRLNV